MKKRKIRFTITLDKQIIPRVTLKPTQNTVDLLKSLKVNQSLVAKGPEGKKIQRTLSSSCSSIAKTTNMRFTTHKISNNSTRVWRIK